VHIGPRDERARGVPHLADLVTTDRDKALVEFLEIGSNMGWPLFGPPGIPQDRLNALRQAFNQLLQDEEFAQRLDSSMGAPLRPTSGSDLENTVARALETPDSVITEVRDLLGI